MIHRSKPHAGTEGTGDYSPAKDKSQPPGTTHV